MKKLIGICGKIGHGKDEAAKALIAKGYSRIAFADAMKEALLKLNPIVACRQGPYGITDDASYPITWLNYLSKLVETYGWDEAKKSEDVRRLLQVFGTEVGRNYFGEKVWISLVDQKIEELREFSTAMLGQEPKVVITDVRFPNEGHYIKDNDGLLIWVYRPDMESTAEQARHASEKMGVASMADVKVMNTGTIEELHSKILEVCGVFTPEEEFTYGS